MVDLDDHEARSALAYADTLAGMCIANVSTTLPHSMGQPISGRFPGISHGLSLALVYPGFFQLTHQSSIRKFAQIARLWNNDLLDVSDEEAAEASIDELDRFLTNLDLVTSLSDLAIPIDELEGLIEDAMECPDTYVNPRVPSRVEVRDMFLKLWNTE